MSKFEIFLDALMDSPSYLITVIVSVLAFLVLYYTAIKFLLKNNSLFVVLVFIIVSLIAGLIILYNDGDGLLFLIIPCLLILIVVILYSVEIKRYIWAHRSFKKQETVKTRELYDVEKVNNCINVIIKAAQDMSKTNTGAIIVFATNNIPSQVLDSGVKINSDISSELIESIFFPKTPLHDGAMIIDGTKIIGAGCFLPLSQKIDKIPKDLGTRHRAGIGITETIDVMSLIVSEETGIISIAKAGNITRYVDAELLKKALQKYYWQDLEMGK